MYEHLHQSGKILLAMATVMFVTGGPVSAGDTAPTTDKNKKEKVLPLTDGKFMYSITLHSPEKIKSLLNRADKLSQTMRTKGNHSKIALVLHGPEIKYFSKKHYNKFQSIVDTAARLDGDKLIEIKICKSKMDELGVKDNDIPSFVEIIPYAPDEEKKLLDQGYIYL